MAVLETYLDESGFNRNDACVMAGYVASDRQWKRFSVAWENVRAEFEAPIFHAKRFFNVEAFKHDYSGWTAADKKLYLGRLVESTKRHKLNPIRIAVDVALFNSLSEDERRYITGGIYRGGKWIRQGAPTKPYFLSLIACVSRALGFTPSNFVLHFYLDEQNEFAPNVLELYKNLKDSFFSVEDMRLGAMAFSTRGKNPPLQLADLVSYLSLQQGLETISNFEADVLEGLLPRNDVGLGWVKESGFIALKKEFRKALDGLKK